MGKAAVMTLEDAMREQIALRRAAIRQEVAETGSFDATGHDDIFSRLVLANESESEKTRLDDNEIVSIFTPSFEKRNV